MKPTILITVMSMLFNLATITANKSKSSRVINSSLCTKNKCRDTECIKDKEYCREFEAPTGLDCECAKFKDSSFFCLNNICHNTFCDLTNTFCYTFKNNKGINDCECKNYKINLNNSNSTNENINGNLNNNFSSNYENSNSTTSEKSDGNNTDIISIVNNTDGTQTKNNVNNSEINTDTISLEVILSLSSGLNGNYTSSSNDSDANNTYDIKGSISISNSALNTSLSNYTNQITNNTISSITINNNISNNIIDEMKSEIINFTQTNKNSKLCNDQTCGIENCTKTNTICMEYTTMTFENHCKCVEKESKCTGINLNTCNNVSCGENKCTNAFIENKLDCVCVSTYNGSVCSDRVTCNNQICSSGKVCKNIGLKADDIKCTCIEISNEEKSLIEEDVGKCLGEKKDTCNRTVCADDYICTEFSDKKTCDCVKLPDQTCTGKDKNFCNSVSCGDDKCLEYKEGELIKCRCIEDKLCRAGKCKGVNCEVNGGKCVEDVSGNCFCGKAIDDSSYIAPEMDSTANASLDKKLNKIIRKFKNQNKLT